MKKHIQRIFTFLILLILTQSYTAEAATKRLAYSKKLGVEVLVERDSNQIWCGDNVHLQLKATNSEFFNSSDLQNFVNKLAKVIQKDCKKVDTLTLSGHQADDSKVVYLATADSEENWSLKPQDSISTQFSDTTDLSPTASNKDNTKTDTDVLKGQKIGTTKKRTQGSLVLKLEDKSPTPQTTITEKKEQTNRVGKKSNDLILEEIYNSTPRYSNFGAGGEINLLGDWNSKFTCKNWNQTYESILTLSIYHQEGARFKAYWISDDNFGVFQGEGNYYQNVNQLNYKHTKTLQKAKYYQWNDILAKYDSTTNRLTPLNVPKGCEASGFRRVNTTPEKAITLKRNDDFADNVISWAYSRKVGRKIIGKQNQGTFRFPTCEKVEKWASTYSIDQRIAVNAPNTNRMLLHFQDEIFSQYFGTPYYYLSKNDLNTFNNTYRKECWKKLPRATFNSVRQVVRDSQSYHAVRLRRQIDKYLTDFPTYWIRNGYSNEEIYNFSMEFSKLTEETLRRQRFPTREGNEFRSGHTAQDLDVLRQEAKLYADYYRGELFKKYLTAAEKLSSSKNPFKDARLLQENVAKFEHDDRTRVDQVYALIGKKLDGVVEQKAEQLSEHWRGNVLNFEDIEEEKRKIRDMKAEMKGLVGQETLKILDKSFNDVLQQHVAASILEREITQAKLIKVVAGDTKLKDKLKKIAKTEKSFHEAQLIKEKETYTAAVKTIRKKALKVVFEEANKNDTLIPEEIAKEPVVNWIQNVRSFDNQNHNGLIEVWGDYPAKAEYEKIIKLTKKKYIKALKKAIVLKFKNHFPKNHFIEIPVLKKLATATKKPFFPFDEPQLKTLNTIQLKHAESIFNDVLDQQELLAKNTFKVIETMDNKSILKMLSKARYFTDELEKLSKENSQFKGLYKKWDKVDEKLFQSLCKTKTEIGGDKKLPVYAGEHTISLGDFACAAKINDLDVVEYTKPGFFGGDTYSMKFVGTDGDNLTLSLKAAEIVPGTKALIGKSYRDSGAIEEQLTKDQWLELVLDFIQSAESMTGFTFERKALSESTQSAGIFRKIKDQFFGENTGKTDNNRGYEGIYNCDGFGVHDLELKKDGKGYATFGVFGVKQKTAITYEVDDDNLVISGNGQNHVLNLEHGMLKDEGNPKIFGNCKPVQIN